VTSVNSTQIFGPSKPSDDTETVYPGDKVTPKSTVGLSRLQRQILEIAAEGRQARLARGGDNGVDVYSSQLLHRIWGFDAGQENWRRGPRAFSWEHHHVGSPLFNPDEIGRAKYNAAKASLSRALRRLQDRGLVTLLRGRYSQWAGIALTGAE
jgi:hypothetical protein